MQNLLIVEDDLIQSHLLANFICREVQYIRLYNIASTGKDAINIIKEEKVDIILLDLKLPDMTGIDIINYIEEHNITKYKSSIIIVTGEMDLLKQIIGNNYVYNYSSKVNGFDSIINSIKKLVNENQHHIEMNLINEQIKLELQKLNFDFSYIGTKYLYECICECFYKDNIYNINFKKEIYPIISQKYNKTINSVKTSICQSTSIMYCNTDEKLLSNYLGYNIINKPKPKDVIITVLEKLK